MLSLILNLKIINLEETMLPTEEEPLVCLILSSMIALALYIVAYQLSMGQPFIVMIALLPLIQLLSLA